jgi:hypothetical protein
MRDREPATREGADREAEGNRGAGDRRGEDGERNDRGEKEAPEDVNPVGAQSQSVGPEQALCDERRRHREEEDAGGEMQT